LTRLRLALTENVATDLTGRAESFSHANLRSMNFTWPAALLVIVGLVLVIGRMLDLVTDCRNHLRNIDDLLQDRLGKKNMDDLLDED
jgi:hypothetical protein